MKQFFNWIFATLGIGFLVLWALGFAFLGYIIFWLALNFGWVGILGWVLLMGAAALFQFMGEAIIKAPFWAIGRLLGRKPMPKPEPAPETETISNNYLPLALFLAFGVGGLLALREYLIS